MVLFLCLLTHFPYEIPLFPSTFFLFKSLSFPNWSLFVLFLVNLFSILSIFYRSEIRFVLSCCSFILPANQLRNYFGYAWLCLVMFGYV